MDLLTVFLLLSLMFQDFEKQLSDYDNGNDFEGAHALKEAFEGAAYLKKKIDANDLIHEQLRLLLSSSKNALLSC